MLKNASDEATNDFVRCHFFGFDRGSFAIVEYDAILGRGPILSCICIQVILS